MRPLLPLLALSLAALLAALPAHAQQKVLYQISAGTGFVVNNDGHVVTNDHVVRGCQSISIGTPAGEVPATLIANDRARDLAVLKTGYVSQVYAPMRWNISELNVGEAVIVMGFPGYGEGNTEAKYRKSSVIALTGPSGEQGLLQIKSVAKKGNSGGPVLDAAGNVIAVVSGMAMTYQVDASTGSISQYPIGTSDVAITLPALRDFLQQHGVGFYESASNLMYGDGYLREQAAHFIVPVRCVQGVSYQK